MTVQHECPEEYMDKIAPNFEGLYFDFIQLEYPMTPKICFQTLH